MVTVLSVDLGIKNFAWCTLSLIMASFYDIYYMENVDLLEREGITDYNAHKISMKIVVPSLTNYLLSIEDKIFEHPIDFIIIEQQLKKATKWKTIGHIFDAFIRITCKHRGIKIPEIIYQSAKQKLKLSPNGNIETNVHNKEEEEEENKLLSSSTLTRRRKKKSIELCDKILSSNVKYKFWLNFIRSQTKKDDLSDILLQAFYFIQKYLNKEEKKNKKKKKNEPPLKRKHIEISSPLEISFNEAKVIKTDLNKYVINLVDDED